VRRKISSLPEVPVEENRFVLFVDVAGSTGLAEHWAELAFTALDISTAQAV